MKLTPTVVPDRPRITLASGSTGPEVGSSGGMDPFEALLGELFRRSPRGGATFLDAKSSGEVPEARPGDRRPSRRAEPGPEPGPGWEAAFACLPTVAASSATVAPASEALADGLGPGFRSPREVVSSLEPVGDTGSASKNPEPEAEAGTPASANESPERAEVSSPGPGGEETTSLEEVAGLNVGREGEKTFEAEPGVELELDSGVVSAEEASEPPGGEVDGASRLEKESGWAGDGAGGEGEPVPVDPASGAGTPGAETDGEMMAALTMNETAGFDGQELPGRTDVSDTAGASGGIAGDRSVEVTGFSSSPIGVVGMGAPSGSLPSGQAAPLPTEPAGSVERVEQLARMAEQAVVQGRARGGEGEYEVSVRPDRETEIRLKITMTSGGPEVRAELRQGDAIAFQAHWSQLQSRLADQGIRLLPADAPTMSAGGFAFGTGTGFGSGAGSHAGSRSQSGGPEGVPIFGAFTRRRSSGERIDTVRSTSTPGGRGRGWETWA